MKKNFTYEKMKSRSTYYIPVLRFNRKIKENKKKKEEKKKIKKRRKERR